MLAPRNMRSSHFERTKLTVQSLILVVTFSFLIIGSFARVLPLDQDDSLRRREMTFRRLSDAV